FPCGYSADLWRTCLRIDATRYFDDHTKRLGGAAERMNVLAHPVQPHSEGEILLESADPQAHPSIRMNYFGDPHDMKVMVAVMRRALDIVAHWPGAPKPGPMNVTPRLPRLHGLLPGQPP